jgi:hypothetical protein
LSRLDGVSFGPHNAENPLMTFDEDLKRAFEPLADRLREEIAKHVHVAVADLASAAERDRASAIAEARAAAERDATEKLSASAAGERKDAHDRGLEEGRAQGWEDGREQGLFEGRQASERAGREALDAAVAAARAEARPADPAAAERLVESIRAIDRSRSLSDILDALATGAAREVPRVALLVVAGARLRGWRFIGFGTLDHGTPVEIAFEEAGAVAEAVRTNAAISGEMAAPSFAEGHSGGLSLSLPIAMGGHVVAALYADAGGDPNAAPNPRSRIPTSEIELLVRHAARCLEALTAIKAALALSATQTAGPQTSAPSDLAQETDEADAAAKRYARLLVSEIKLYHEAEVVAGRRDRDLATRLGGEIARARVLYEQRVPPPVLHRADHFRDELVRTLANGDASLLHLT